MPEELEFESVADLVVGQQVTCTFGGLSRLIKNKINLPAVVTGVTPEGLYNVRLYAEGVFIDIAALGMDHISTKAI